ncbi:MAG: Replicative DNA helicase [Parcubacteria group bacterium ADurb.Bin192]|nr:MAG: Replicative DNA helicase [Parcubacteria group bacterium ADurb.Bin192]
MQILSFKEAIQFGHVENIGKQKLILPTLGLGQSINDIQEGDFIVITARGGTGKTWLMIQMAYDLAQAGQPVGFFSGEMSVGELGLYRFSKLAEETRHLKESDPPSKKIMAIEKMKDVPMFLPVIEDRWQFRQTCVPVMQQMIEERGIKAFFFDHLRFFVNKAEKMNEREVVEQTVLDMRLFSKKYKTPIILAVQPKQISSDEEASIDTLKGTSAISQDATCVMVLDRPRKKQKRTEDSESVYEPYTVLKVEKSRHAIGNKRIKIFLDYNNGKFIEWDKGGQELCQQFAVLYDK